MTHPTSNLKSHDLVDRLRFIERYLERHGASAEEIVFSVTIDEAITALSERSAPETSLGGWQPIETAPRHYKPILLKQDDTVGEGWHASHIGWEFANLSYVMRRKPTHWMPLPGSVVETSAIPDGIRPTTIDPTRSWAEQMNASSAQKASATQCVWRSGCKHHDVCDAAGCCVPGGTENGKGDGT